MLKYLLFFFASLYLADGATECYDCGYLIDGWKPDGHNVQHPMTDGTPQCGDEATMADRVTSCSDEGECCGVVREFFVQEATNITEEFIQVEVRHGCEKKLAEQFSDYHEFLCKSGEGTENQCFNITYDNIPEHEATFADVCFCNEDRCNKDVPVMPDPPTEGPTPCPECVQCYSCGYMKNGDSETEKLPETPFCNDFANTDANVVNCGKDDCCGMLKEYFIRVDDATGENSTQIIGRHGCAADMEHLSHYSATCKWTTPSLTTTMGRAMPQSLRLRSAFVLVTDVTTPTRSLRSPQQPLPRGPQARRQPWLCF